MHNKYTVNTQSDQLAGESPGFLTWGEVGRMPVSCKICLEGAQLYQKSNIRVHKVPWLLRVDPDNREGKSQSPSCEAAPDIRSPLLMLEIPI